MAAVALHHHVPQGYQDGFSVDGKIWVFDRVTQRFRRDQPRNVGAIRNDYTVVHSSGARDSRVETEFFSRVDSEGIRVIRQLANRNRISSGEADTLTWFLAYGMVRGPRFQRMLNELGTVRAKLHARHELRSPEQMRRMIEECPDLTDEERASADPDLLFEFAKSEDYIVSLNRDYGVKLMMQHGEELRRLFLTADWVVAHAAGDAEFLTTDNPLVSVGAVRTFPLSRGSCLMIHGNGNRLSHKDMDAEMVHRINLDTALHCERIVLASTEGYLRRVVGEVSLRPEVSPIFVIDPPSV